MWSVCHECYATLEEIAVMKLCVIEKTDSERKRYSPSWSIEKDPGSEREVSFVYVDKEISCNKESMFLSFSNTIESV